MSDPTTFSIHHCSNALSAELRKYLQAQYHIRDEGTVNERTALFEDTDTISQKPYLEATPSYELASKFSDLELPSATKELLSNLSTLDVGIFAKPYVHQAEALQAFANDEKSILTATGTGSGKTETFLFSILSSFAEEAARNQASLEQKGFRALILYPMNALVADQLSRMRRLLGAAESKACLTNLCGRHLTFGMYTGRTPFPGLRGPRFNKRAGELLSGYYKPVLDNPTHLAELKKRGKWPAKDVAAFFGSGLWEKRLKTSPDDAELLMRHEMQENCPDILITNYSMLEYMLLRPIEQPIFDATAKWLEEDGNFLTFVLDEAHMYRGTTGAEVAYLIRRLLARLNISGDKVRFILTTASVGGEKVDEDAAMEFAARLTGKRAEGAIRYVKGTREDLGEQAAATTQQGDYLSAFDTEEFRKNCHDLETTRGQTTKLIEDLGLSPIRAGKSVVNELYHSLREFLPARLLVSTLSGKATKVEELEAIIFPNNSPQDQRNALDALLALANCGKDEETGRILLPARLHLFLRGVSGIYACVNPACSERRVPVSKGVIGTLYSEPRITCKCGSRVYELFTHRDCGAAYFKGYTPGGNRPDFVWNEPSNLVGDPGKVLKFGEIELYPAQSSKLKNVRAVWLQLASGKLVWEKPHDETNWAPLFVPDISSRPPSIGTKDLLFEHCALCTKSVRRPKIKGDKPRIMDLRTKGEQPFGHVVKMQMLCQPLDLGKSKEDYPNQGRKVLVFSDGRQKAAKLAQSVPDEVGADCFRELLVFGRRLLAESNRPLNKVSLSQWYAVLIAACEKKHVILFDGDDASSLRDAIYQYRRFHESDLDEALTSTIPTPPFAFKRFLYKQACATLYSLRFLSVGWLEPLAKHFRVFDADFSKISPAWAKLPPEARMALVVAWLKRIAADFAIDESVKLTSLRSLLAGYYKPKWEHKGTSGRVLTAILQDLQIDVPTFDQALRDTFMTIANGEGMLNPDALSLNIDLDHHWWSCSDCTAMSPMDIQGKCPECGSTSGNRVDPNTDIYTRSRKGFWRDRLRGVLDGTCEPIMIQAEEHTAQLTQRDSVGSQPLTEKYELRFQDVSSDLKTDPAIDMLSCTTTMEVGIDIGSLTAVALRNVPPQRENYQQRAGRAGRRGSSVSTVATYCQGNAHDNHYYANVDEIASGKPRLLHVKVDNEKIAKRHLYAYLIQEFFRHQVPVTGSSIMNSLGTIEVFYGSEGLNLTDFTASLSAYSSASAREVMKCCEWLDQDFDGVSDKAKWVVDTATGFADRLEQLRSKADEVIAREMELPEEEKTELMDFLFEHSLLPSYAFPRDLATFSVEQWDTAKQDVVSKYAPTHSITRALSEYAPGRLIVIDKKTYRSAVVTANAPSSDPNRAARLFNNVNRKPYIFCSAPTCSYVEDAGVTGSAGRAREMCPLCQEGTLKVQPLITPEIFMPKYGRDLNELDDEQEFSFATPAQFPVPVASGSQGTAWSKDVGTNVSAGWWNDAELVVVNKGDSEEMGFGVCNACGLAHLVSNPKTGSHERPYWVKGGVRNATCTGTFENVFLGARFRTDLLLIRTTLIDGLGAAADPAAPDYSALNDALHTLAEALPLAASRRYDLDHTEFSSGYRIRQVSGQLVAELYMFDTLSGGAGYARCAGEDIEIILREDVRAILRCEEKTGKGCQRSCYRCLRNYQNQIRHGSLDRVLGLDLLNWMLDGTPPPNRSVEDQERALAGLAEMLKFDGINVKSGTRTAAGPVPIVAEFKGKEVGIAVFNGLIAKQNAVTLANNVTSGTPLPLNEYLLTRNLPLAFREVRKCLGKTSA